MPSFDYYQSTILETVNCSTLAIGRWIARWFDMHKVLIIRPPFPCDNAEKWLWIILEMRREDIVRGKLMCRRKLYKEEEEDEEGEE